MFASNSNKKESKNIKALFSVICLCIIALGLIVYFATNSKDKVVNEPTTIVETTEVHHAVTVTEKKETTTAKITEPKTTEKPTEASTMPVDENNTPYKSYYKYPLTEKVVNGYSEELVLNKTMGDYRAHAGVDFAGKKGDKVVAINNGIVTKVYTDDMYGIVVEIDHGGTLIAKYCGLESASVKKGTKIDIGNTIGTLGKIPCEEALDSHLHFECMFDGKTVNPLDAMSKTE